MDGGLGHITYQWESGPTFRDGVDGATRLWDRMQRDAWAAALI